MMKYEEVQFLIKNQVAAFFLIPLPFLTLFFGYEVVQQVIFGRPFGLRSISDIEVVISFVLTLLFLILFVRARLTTHVDQASLYIQFPPFNFLQDKILLCDIESVEIVSTGHHAGVGWQIGPDGKIRTAYGYQGITIVSKDGTTTILGTQNPEMLLNALQANLEPDIEH